MSIHVRSFASTSGFERLDAAVNAWVDTDKVRILSVQVNHIPQDDNMSGRPLYVYTVLYESEQPKLVQLVSQPVSVRTASRTRRARVPTVEALSSVHGETERRVECMAGIFGVPEGWKLAPEDTEVAPTVCLSPEFDLEPYADLFGNLEDV
jgi:hypothetical protein